MGFKYTITRNMKVHDPESGETRTVKAGDEVPEAERWTHLGAWLSDGTVIRQSEAEVAADKAAQKAAEEPVAEEDVEELVEESEENSEERFPCPVDDCDKTYDSEGWLERHIEDKHTESDEDE